MREFPYPTSLTGFVVNGPYVFIAVALGMTSYVVLGTLIEPYVTGIRPQILTFTATTILGIIAARPFLAALRRIEMAAPITISATLTRVENHHHTVVSASITFLCFCAYGIIMAASWTYLSELLPSTVGVPALAIAYVSSLVVTEALALHHTGNNPNNS